MAGQSWSIDIVPASGGGVQFNPDVYGVAAGSPLQAQKGDLVSWNNQTDNDHTIVVNVSPTQTFTAKSWKSTDAYQITNAAGTSVTYTCDGNETGTIDVVA
jgi:plastocyanin